MILRQFEMLLAWAIQLPLLNLGFCSCYFSANFKFRIRYPKSCALANCIIQPRLTPANPELTQRWPFVLPISACFQQRLRVIQSAAKETQTVSGNTLDQRSVATRYLRLKKPSNRRNTSPGRKGQDWHIPSEWQKAKLKFGSKTEERNGASGMRLKWARKKRTTASKKLMVHK